VSLRKAESLKAIPSLYSWALVWECVSYIYADEFGGQNNQLVPERPEGVILAKASIHILLIIKHLDSRFRGNDSSGAFSDGRLRGNDAFRASEGQNNVLSLPPHIRLIRLICRESLLLFTIDYPPSSIQRFFLMLNAQCFSPAFP